ncbi:lysogeny maintenance protein PflM [Pseudomonas solani]|uniref:lysogeny maintenance protein PflM n=1 Tax=Pseudomonas solani TaxID=2731552 RepID=UPI003C2DFA32
MNSPSHYLRLPHPPDCACSVCWSRRAPAAVAASRSTSCDQCRPAQISRVAGRWVCQPASFCEKHRPARRAPKYWYVVYDSGPPTPFVPVHEPFED